MESLYSFIDEINTTGKFTLTKNAITFCDKVYQIFSIVCPDGRDLFLYQTPSKNVVSYEHFEVIESKKPFRAVLPKGRSKIPSHKTFQIQESPFNLSVLFFNENPVYYSVDSPFEWKPYKNFNAIQVDGSLLIVSDYYFEKQSEFEERYHSSSNQQEEQQQQQVEEEQQQQQVEEQQQQQVEEEQQHVEEEQQYMEEYQMEEEQQVEEQQQQQFEIVEEEQQQVEEQQYVEEEQVQEEQQQYMEEEQQTQSLEEEQQVEEQQTQQFEIVEEDLQDSEEVEDYYAEEIEREAQNLETNDSKKRVTFQIQEDNFQQILKDYEEITKDNIPLDNTSLLSSHENILPKPKLSSIQFVHDKKKYMIPCMKFVPSDKLNFYQLHTYPISENNKMDKDKYAFYLPEKNKYYLTGFGKKKYLLHISNQLLIVTDIQQKQTNMYKMKDIFKLDNHNYLFTGQSVFVPMEHKKYFDNQYGTIRHVFIPKTNYV